VLHIYTQLFKNQSKNGKVMDWKMFGRTMDGQMEGRFKNLMSPYFLFVWGHKKTKGINDK
jgi:hypothetical protein